MRKFYTPILEKRYDQAADARRDIEQLEQIAANFPLAAQMLTDLTLDPPSSTQDLAGPPLREEDYLILSTIHSAKGCEWDAVYVIHAADGNIPSDMATGIDEEIEEERRLFYVALTRAKDFLEVCFPLRYYQQEVGDRRPAHVRAAHAIPARRDSRPLRAPSAGRRRNRRHRNSRSQPRPRRRTSERKSRQCGRDFHH